MTITRMSNLLCCRSVLWSNARAGNRQAARMEAGAWARLSCRRGATAAPRSCRRSSMRWSDRRAAFGPGRQRGARSDVEAVGRALEEPLDDERLERRARVPWRSGEQRRHVVDRRVQRRHGEELVPDPQRVEIGRLCERDHRPLCLLGPFLLLSNERGSTLFSGARTAELEDQTAPNGHSKYAGSFAFVARRISITARRSAAERRAY